MSGGDRWSDADLAVLREWYPKGGWRGVAVRLSAPRGRVAITNAAQVHGVEATESPGRTTAGWAKLRSFHRRHGRVAQQPMHAEDLEGLRE